MQFTIRKGEEKDFPVLLQFIKDEAVFEKTPDAVTNSVEQMNEEKQYFGFLVAEVDNVIVGIAVYFFAYFTFVGKSLYLDDIHVKTEYRKQGIGTALLNEFFSIAQKEKCKRVRWQVSDWNTIGIDLYKKLGASISTEWLNCDFNKTNIDNFFVKK